MHMLGRRHAPSPTMTPQAAARATTLASALQEKARLYSGPGSFLQRNATWLSQQALTA